MSSSSIMSLNQTGTRLSPKQSENISIRFLWLIVKIQMVPPNGFKLMASMSMAAYFMRVRGSGLVNESYLTTHGHLNQANNTFAFGAYVVTVFIGVVHMELFDVSKFNVL